MMKIGGLQKTTLIDYPGHIACIVFTIGCSFRCPFCYNKTLVEKTAEPMPEGKIFDFLKQRKGLTEGVVITGGEPLLQKGLPDFIKKIKRAGYKVKLDTNGYCPEALEKMLKIIDYVSMDVKNSPELYSKTAGVTVDIGLIKKSIKLIMDSKADYEFRATIVPSLHNAESVEGMGKLVKGAKVFYLQYFHPELELLDKTFKKVKAPSDSEMEDYKKILEKYVKKVAIRKG